MSGESGCVAPCRTAKVRVAEENGSPSATLGHKNKPWIGSRGGEDGGEWSRERQRPLNPDPMERLCTARKTRKTNGREESDQ